MIKEISVKDIPAPPPKGVVADEIRRFLSSEWDACEVDTTGYRNAQSARQYYNYVAVNIGAAIYPMVRRGKLYLVRENLGRTL